MSGGLMQLIAYGSQDIFLTGNPQITFFKTIYRRYTNFAMEAIEQTFEGIPNFGQKITATLTRNADLISRMYIRAILPAVDANEIVSENFTNVDKYPDIDKFAWCPEIGHALIKSVIIEIGGQQIDKQFGEWLHIWNELTLPREKINGYNEMIGNISEMIDFTTSKDEFILYIPLQFWFCRHTGNAIPIISLQYHDIRIIVKLRNVEECLLIESNGLISRFDNVGVSLRGISLFVDYIYIDTDERRRFAQASHEYLIEQLQIDEQTNFIDGQIRPNIFLNHPTKEIIWTLNHSLTNTLNQWFNYTDKIGEYVNGVYIQDCENPLVNAKLILNNFDRFSIRKGEYFNWVQNWQHHNNIPTEGINVYSFCLNPEKHQPSGTMNFSRIDNTILEMRLKTFTLVYNYELRIVDNKLVLIIPEGTINEKFEELRIKIRTSDTDNFFDCDIAFDLLDFFIYDNTQGTPALNTILDDTGTQLIITLNHINMFSTLENNKYFVKILENLTDDIISCIRKFYKLKSSSFTNLDDTVLTVKTTTNFFKEIAISYFYNEIFEDCITFTRISNNKETFDKTFLFDGHFRLFATNYNVLRVMGGMGGLAFNN